MVREHEIRPLAAGFREVCGGIASSSGDSPQNGAERGEELDADEELDELEDWDDCDEPRNTPEQRESDALEDPAMVNEERHRTRTRTRI